MDKKIYLGLGAVATAGAIIGGIMMAQNKDNPLKIEPGKDESAQNAQKIEELWREELKNTEKYSFCLGEATVQTSYGDPVLNGSGTINYKSREVLVLNKESQKLSIISRNLEFDYHGNMNTQMGELAVNIPVKEHGTLTETYGKNEMPVRMDYSANYIATDPETKNKDWVYSDMDGEILMTGPRTGCAGVYQLDNSAGNDILAGDQMIAIDRECAESDISGSYQGEFSFDCRATDYQGAMEIAETDRIKEELQNTKNTEVFNQDADNAETGFESGEASANGTDGIQTSQPKKPAGDAPTGNEINTQLEDLRREMQSGADATEN